MGMKQKEIKKFIDNYLYVIPIIIIISLLSYAIFVMLPELWETNDKMQSLIKTMDCDSLKKLIYEKTSIHFQTDYEFEYKWRCEN